MMKISSPPKENASDGPPLSRRLRRARLTAALTGVAGKARVEGDPVLAALCKKGWAFRTQRSGLVKTKFDPVLAPRHQGCCAAHGMTSIARIARRAAPHDRLRIARRRAASAASAASAAGAAGTSVRRAPFPVHDLSGPLSAIAPNLAAAALIFLFLVILL